MSCHRSARRTAARLLRVGALALALSLFLPAFANAGGTVALNGDTLVVTGSPDRDGMLVTYFQSTEEMFVESISTGGTGPSEAGPGCRTEDGAAFGAPGAIRVRCPAAGVTKVSFASGGGDDRLVSDLDPERFALTADMGDGDDLAWDQQGGASITLGAGDDKLEGPGRKAMSVSGGAGNDDIYCDGASRGTRASGVRTIDAGSGRDRVCGGQGDDRLDGGAGNDKMYAGDGDDVLDGDAGDDLLKGEDENDRITGGRGEDDIEGGAGRDDIRARDREVDDVACGSRRDTVTADRDDDLSRCETVRLP